jgi:hypothetical protein
MRYRVRFNDDDELVIEALDEAFARARVRLRYGDRPFTVTEDPSDALEMAEGEILPLPRPWCQRRRARGIERDYKKRFKTRMRRWAGGWPPWVAFEALSEELHFQDELQSRLRDAADAAPEEPDRTER